MQSRWGSIGLLLAPFFVCLVFALAGLDEQSSLAYVRTAIAEGEYWRLFTAHLLHSNLTHTLLNLAAWPLIILLAHGALSVKQWGSAFFLVALAISAAFWLFAPDLQWYVGLSGVLHGLLVIAVFTSFNRHRWLYSVILLGLAIKLLWEQYVGALPGSTVWTGRVIVDAHLYGALSGLLFVIYLLSSNRPN